MNEKDQLTRLRCRHCKREELSDDMIWSYWKKGLFDSFNTWYAIPGYCTNCVDLICSELKILREDFLNYQSTKRFHVMYVQSSPHRDMLLNLTEKYSIGYVRKCREILIENSSFSETMKKLLEVSNNYIEYLSIDMPETPANSIRNLMSNII